MIHKFKVGDILELKNELKHITFKSIVIRMKDPGTIFQTPFVVVRVLYDEDPSVIGKEFTLAESVLRLSDTRNIEKESIPLPSIPN